MNKKQVYALCDKMSESIYDLMQFSGNTEVSKHEAKSYWRRYVTKLYDNGKITEKLWNQLIWFIDRIDYKRR